MYIAVLNISADQEQRPQLRVHEGAHLFPVLLLVGVPHRVVFRHKVLELTGPKSSSKDLLLSPKKLVSPAKTSENRVSTGFSHQEMPRDAHLKARAGRRGISLPHPPKERRAASPGTSARGSKAAARRLRCPSPWSPCPSAADPPHDSRPAGQNSPILEENDRNPSQNEAKTAFAQRFWRSLGLVSPEPMAWKSIRKQFW